MRNPLRPLATSSARLLAVGSTRLLAVASALALLAIAGETRGQALEPYETYAQTGILYSEYGYSVADDAYRISLVNGFVNQTSLDAVYAAYEGLYYGYTGWLYFHYDDLIRARDAAELASYYSYLNYDYLWKYVLPYGTSLEVYDFTVATYYSMAYNYYAAAYYEGAFFSVVP